MVDFASISSDEPFDAGALADPAAIARVKTGLDALADVPTLEPRVLAELATIIVVADDPGTSIKGLVALIEHHDFLAEDVMRVGNSAAYARGTRGSTVSQSVVKIGRERVRVLALEAATHRLVDGLPRGRTARHPDLPRRAMAVAATAAAVAKLVRADAGTAALAGLLHDIGVLVLNAAAEGGSGSAVEGVEGFDRVIAERDGWGIDHATAGGLLADRWCLPGPVATAIAWHHGGIGGLGCPSREAACVQIGGEVTRALDGHEPDFALLDVALGRLGLDASVLGRLAEHAGTLSAGRGPRADLPRRLAVLARPVDEDGEGGLLSRDRWLMASRRYLPERPDEDGVLLVCEICSTATPGEDAPARPPSEVSIRHAAALLGRLGRPGRLGTRHLALWLTGASEAELTALLSAWRDEWTGLCAGRPVELRFEPVAAREHGHDLAGLLDRALRRLAAAAAPPVAPAAPKPATRSLYRAG